MTKKLEIIHFNGDLLEFLDKEKIPYKILNNIDNINDEYEIDICIDTLIVEDYRLLKQKLKELNIDFPEDTNYLRII